MRSEYNVATLPWAALLSAIALFFAWRAYRDDRYGTVVRRLGWALIPWALWLVGLMRLVVKIGAALGDWAAGFVFRPTVWLGLIIGVVGVLMIVVGSVGKKPSSRKLRRQRKRERSLDKPATTKAVDKPAADDNFDDIEAILRKHGIQ